MDLERKELHETQQGLKVRDALELHVLERQKQELQHSINHNNKIP